MLAGAAVETFAVGAEAKAPQMSALGAVGAGAGVAVAVVVTAGLGGNAANEAGGCCCGGIGAFVSQLC